MPQIVWPVTIHSQRLQFSFCRLTADWEFPHLTGHGHQNPRRSVFATKKQCSKGAISDVLSAGLNSFSEGVHLSDRAQAWCEMSIALWSSLWVVGTRHLAAPQDVEGCPEGEVLKHIQVDMVLPSSIHHNVLVVLRPRFQSLPAEKQAL